LQVLSSVERYNINTGKWSMAGDLPVPVEMVAASVLGEKIFVFGGAQRNNRNTPAIQVDINIIIVFISIN
jgi:N-acetylneuraminic acid mutarotase